MEWIVILYALGVILTLQTYQKFYHRTIPVYEISVTWFYHLPLMLILHYQFKKNETALIKRKAEVWSQEFFKASKTAVEEKWSQIDWQRWKAATDYYITLTVR